MDFVGIANDIDLAFSRPVAEFFREQGFDGIAYGSSLGPRHNVVLFDVDLAKVGGCGLVEVFRVNLDFDSVTNPYVVTDKFKKSARLVTSFPPARMQ